MADPTTRFHLQRVDTTAGPVALVTIDNGADWQKPSTFGREALESLDGVLGRLRTRDWRGLLLTGKPLVFAAGADIDQFPGITPETAREAGRAGHDLFGRLRELPFVTVAALNGAALGGGVEIALHCDHRTISSSVRHFACPEVFLGIIPGWGGTQLIPRLVGAQRAVDFIVANPLRQNRMLTGPQAFEAGFADDSSTRSSFSTSRSPSSSPGSRKEREADPRRRPRGRGRDLPASTVPGRRSGARRGTRPLSRARSDRKRRRLDDRGGLPRGGGRSRRAAPRTAGAGIRLCLGVVERRVKKGIGRPKRRAPRGHAGGDRRRGSDGTPARAALPSPPGGARRPLRPHPRAGRRGDRPGSAASSPGSSPRVACPSAVRAFSPRSCPAAPTTRASPVAISCSRRSSRS